jgi:hypothetical protein
VLARLLVYRPHKQSNEKARMLIAFRIDVPSPVEKHRKRNLAAQCSREPSLSRNDQQLLNVERVSPAAAPSEPSVSIEFNSTEIAQP